MNISVVCLYHGLTHLNKAHIRIRARITSCGAMAKMAAGFCLQFLSTDNRYLVRWWLVIPAVQAQFECLLSSSETIKAAICVFSLVTDNKVSVFLHTYFQHCSLWRGRQPPAASSGIKLNFSYSRSYANDMVISTWSQYRWPGDNLHFVPLGLPLLPFYVKESIIQ